MKTPAAERLIERRDLPARAARDRVAALLGMHPRRLAGLDVHGATAEADRLQAARNRMTLAD